MTNAINSSQPAFILIEFEDRVFRTSAPSLSALTSSNIVPAEDDLSILIQLRQRRTRQQSSR